MIRCCVSPAVTRIDRAFAPASAYAARRYRTGEGSVRAGTRRAARAQSFRSRIAWTNGPLHPRSSRGADARLGAVPRETQPEDASSRTRDASDESVSERSDGRRPQWRHGIGSRRGWCRPSWCQLFWWRCFGSWPGYKGEYRALRIKLRADFNRASIYFICLGRARVNCVTTIFSSRARERRAAACHVNAAIEFRIVMTRHCREAFSRRENKDIKATATPS